MVSVYDALNDLDIRRRYAGVWRVEYQAATGRL